MPIIMGIIKKTENNKCCWGCGEIGILLHYCWEIKWYSLRQHWQEGLKRGRDRPTPMGGTLKIKRDTLAAEVPPEEQGGTAPHQASQPRVPMPGTEVPTTFSCKNEGDWGYVTWRLLESQAFLLKGPHTDLLGLTPTELHHSHWAPSLLDRHQGHTVRNWTV